MLYNILEEIYLNHYIQVRLYKTIIRHILISTKYWVTNQKTKATVYAIS